MRLERILGNQALYEEITEIVMEDLQESGLESTRGETEVIGRLREMRESWSPGRDIGLEAIVREYGRPALFIVDGKIDDRKLKTQLWKDRIHGARGRIEKVIPSVGRVEIVNHPDMPWAGTAWLVAEDVAVTNRHVALVFGRFGKDGFVFRENPRKKKMKAYLDMLEEHRRGAEQTYRVREILHIEEEMQGAPDVAFLKLDPVSDEGSDPLPEPIPLSSEDPSEGTVVGVVGYAAWDGRRNPGNAMPRIFQDVYNVKRLHPGEVMSQGPGVGCFTHDCSTLGGNSGSAVIDFQSGEAVGLHFAGSFLEENYAVCSTVVRELLWSKLKIQV